MRLVAMGASLGGLRVLSTILRGLSPRPPGAVAIVQHRVDDAKSVLSSVLSRQAGLSVIEPSHGQAVEEGKVYLAPAGYHLLVEDGETFSLSVDQEVERARPSIDVLLESAADVFRERALGVVLTGASADGARGAEAIERRRGAVIVQDPESAEAPACPRAALTRVPGALVLRPEAIADKLRELCATSTGI